MSTLCPIYPHQFGTKHILQGFFKGDLDAAQHNKMRARDAKFIGTPTMASAIRAESPYPPLHPGHAFNFDVSFCLDTDFDDYVPAGAPVGESRP